MEWIMFFATFAILYFVGKAIEYLYQNLIDNYDFYKKKVKELKRKDLL